MNFSVIYSVDVPFGEQILDYAPPTLDLWEETEDDRQYEYGHLEGRWKRGHHRKWAATLKRNDFDEFVNRCGLIAEDVQTMGSIGAPGLGLGWAPAISFTSNDPDAIQGAYVTPIPEVTKEAGDERDWQRIRCAVLAVYGQRNPNASR